MALAARSSLLALLLLASLVILSAGDSSADHATDAASEAAAAAQDSARSWTDVAKDKLNLFSKYRILPILPLNNIIRENPLLPA